MDDLDFEGLVQAQAAQDEARRVSAGARPLHQAPQRAPVERVDARAPARVAGLSGPQQHQAVPPAPRGTHGASVQREPEIPASAAHAPPPVAVGPSIAARPGPPVAPGPTAGSRLYGAPRAAAAAAAASASSPQRGPAPPHLYAGRQQQGLMGAPLGLAAEAAYMRQLLPAASPAALSAREPARATVDGAPAGGPAPQQQQQPLRQSTLPLYSTASGARLSPPPPPQPHPPASAPSASTRSSASTSSSASASLYTPAATPRPPAASVSLSSMTPSASHASGAPSAPSSSTSSRAGLDAMHDYAFRHSVESAPRPSPYGARPGVQGGVAAYSVPSSSGAGMGGGQSTLFHTFVTASSSSSSSAAAAAAAAGAAAAGRQQAVPQQSRSQLQQPAQLSSWSQQPLSQQTQVPAIFAAFGIGPSSIRSHQGGPASTSGSSSADAGGSGLHSPASSSSSSSSYYS